MSDVTNVTAASGDAACAGSATAAGKNGGWGRGLALLGSLVAGHKGLAALTVLALLLDMTGMMLSLIHI